MKRFYSSSTTPAKQGATTTTVSQPWGASQPYIMQGLQSAASLMAQGPQQYTPWNQVANLDPFQLSAMNGTRNYINSSGTQNFMKTASNGVQDLVSNRPNQVQQIANQGMNNSLGYMTNNNMYDPAQATNQMAYGNNTNPYTKVNADAALQQLSNNFQTNTLTGMRRNAIGNGSYGSSRNEMAEGLAAGNLSQQMYDASNQIYGNAYNTNQQNSLAALGLSANQQNQQAGLANQLFNVGNQQKLDSQNIGLTNYQNAINAPLAMLQQQGLIGAQQQQQNQNVLTDATNRWNFNQDALWNSVNQFKNMIDPNTQLGGSGSGQSTSTQQQPGVNKAALATSGLLSAAGLAASLYGSK